MKADASMLYRRKGEHPDWYENQWRAFPQKDGSVWISPNDGRVPSGQRINPETFEELFEEVRPIKA